MFHRLRFERKRWGAIAPKGGEKMGTQPLSPKIKEENRGTLKGGSQRATVSLVEKRPVNKGETNFPEMVCRFCLVL